jgi:hypothetical protein
VFFHDREKGKLFWEIKTMKKRFCKFFATAIILGLVLTSTSQAIMTELTNGTFDSDLSGWYDSTTGVIWDAGTGDGYALFSEVTGATSFLWQDFDLPAGAQELSFEINFTSEGGPGPVDTDNFDALLYRGMSIEELYSINNSLAYGQTGWTSGDMVVAWDVSSLAGQNVRLAFELHGDEDGYDTTVKLDNVKVSIIPVPGAIVLGCIGAGLVGVFRRARKLK